MSQIFSILTPVLTAAGALWLLGGCGSLANQTQMRYGHMEVRVRGPGVDTSCRTDAHYSSAGAFNSSTRGWLLQFGWASDDPRWHTGSFTKPATWCQLRFNTYHPLTSGATFRTDSPPDSPSALKGIALAVEHPYNPFANPGTVWVDEATRSHVRGRFQMTLNRYGKYGGGEPITIDGEFEIHRDPPAQR